MVAVSGSSLGLRDGGGSHTVQKKQKIV